MEGFQRSEPGGGKYLKHQQDGPKATKELPLFRFF